MNTIIIIEEEICHNIVETLMMIGNMIYIRIPRGYDMSSTPLNDCIMAAMKLVPAFQKKI